MFRHQRYINNAGKLDTEKDEKLLVDISTVSISFLTNPKCYAIEFSCHNDAQLAFSVIRKYRHVVSAPPPSPVSSQEIANNLDFPPDEKGSLNTAGISIPYSGGIGGRSFRVDWISPVSEISKSKSIKIKGVKDHVKETLQINSMTV